MEIELRVVVKGRYHNIGVATTIEEMHQKCFEPMDVNNTPHIFGGVSPEQGKIVMRTREDAAKVIAENLAKLIVEVMKSKDTKDGYSKEELSE